MKNLFRFLTGIPMTALSGVFLLSCIILSLLDVTLPLYLSPAIVTILISGSPLVYNAVHKAIYNKGISKISSALLISIAMMAAIITKDLFAAGEVAFIMAIGEILEDLTTDRAKKGLKELISSTPLRGRRIDGENESYIPVSEIKKGDILRILPGESIPADGIIISGETSVDQSLITGESLPVDLTVSDEVFCGTVNRFGSVDIEVTKEQKDSSLQGLIRLIEEAEKNKADIQRTADKWASILVPVALLIAIAAGLIQQSVTVAVTILVVFCPCALVLATPTAIMAAIGQASKHGVIIKSGEALEKMGKIDTVAFDKTGTLTSGKMSVFAVEPFNSDMTRDELSAIAACAEYRSEHPLGKAIVSYASENGIAIQSPDKFVMESGKGVLAVLNGKRILCGSERFFEQNGIEISTEEQLLSHKHRSGGSAVIYVALDGKSIGIIVLNDTVRADSAKAVKKLHSLNINTVLLTGDNAQSANAIAKSLGITDVRAGLLPEDKVNAIKELTSNGKSVCMIGDGINDAPALKTASVGIAMGKIGSDITVQASDIALIGDELSKLPYLKRLANATLKTIRLSITLSLVINLLAVILSFMQVLTPTTGALVHNAGSVFVILIAALLYDRKFDQ